VCVFFFILLEKYKIIVNKVSAESFIYSQAIPSIMATEKISVICKSCGEVVHITKSDKDNMGNLMLCPYCEHNLFSLSLY